MTVVGHPSREARLQPQHIVMRYILQELLFVCIVLRYILVGRANQCPRPCVYSLVGAEGTPENLNGLPRETFFQAIRLN